MEGRDLYSQPGGTERDEVCGEFRERVSSIGHLYCSCETR